VACKARSSALPVLTYQTYAALRFSKTDLFGSRCVEPQTGTGTEA
jgi:hypothetical protein